MDVATTHYLFELAAYFAGAQYYVYLRRNTEDPISSQHRLYIVMGAALGALVGSRLLSALEFPDLFFHPPDWLYYYQGKTIVGGLIGGTIGVELTKLLIGESRRSGDLFTYPLILAMIIGRIGCQLAGVSDGTVGNPSNLPWAFDQGDGISRHPTSLYEILFLLFLWGGLEAYKRRSLEEGTPLKEGSQFRLFLFSYLFFRFWIEFIKPVHPLLLGISAIQLACLSGVVYYGYRMFKEGVRGGKTLHLL